MPKLIQLQLSDVVDRKLRLEAAKLCMSKRKFIVYLFEKWAETKVKK